VAAKRLGKDGIGKELKLELIGVLNITSSSLETQAGIVVIVG
jgi:hypothetical protein